MFMNLIESDSHTKEFKRRGLFILATMSAYTVLFLVGGIMSIYAYNAHLEKQTLEIVAMLQPVEPQADPIVHPDPIRVMMHPAGGPNVNIRKSEPPSLNPTLAPHGVVVSTKQPPPLPPNSPNYVIGDTNANAWPESSSNTKNTGGGGNDVNAKVGEPPPAMTIKKPVETPAPPKREVVKISQILNGRAISLPQPIFPQIAIQARASGTVNVQVLIDETGKVISAQAVSGHPLLQRTATQAAMQARFSPTVLNGQPVKVSGVITYNFKLQQ